MELRIGDGCAQEAERYLMGSFYGLGSHLTIEVDSRYLYMLWDMGVITFEPWLATHEVTSSKEPLLVFSILALGYHRKEAVRCQAKRGP